ncbi:hypothetical protein N7505_009771 [Penicillium chrysogenum]|uniref:Uncharacterized protein n=1 Tax=Penicillium chrysogenum TaxID=5076 RepID=A0ABQ8W8Y0_PENCH|nr:hypothetical protein N7505_009771 [Penicillium chrysogenum]
MASQVDLTQDQQDAPNEISESKHHEMLNIRSEREERLSESVPLDASPQVHVVADATQKDTLLGRPSSSLPRECSVQTDTRSGPRSLDPLPLKKIPSSSALANTITQRPLRAPYNN